MFEEETPETVEETPTETEETEAVDEKPYEAVEAEPAPDTLIPSEAKNPAGANADFNADESEIDPETVEKGPTETEETEAVEEIPTETANNKPDEGARFKAATDGFDRLEKFTFKIFNDVFDSMPGVNVTARQTVADLLLFIAAKCKNAGKITDFKRTFNISKDFGFLPQSAANYVPLLINLTAKLKNGGGFTSGVYNELRGILSNIICDETAVDFELKILKQIIGV